MWNIETFDILPSTMDMAHSCARDAKRDFVIVAKEQNAGRGRHGNLWIAPQGNLNCSIVLTPQTQIKDIGQYSFMAAVALANTVEPLLKNEFEFRHKWPNDALVNDRKLSGLLLEIGEDNKGDKYLVIGLGVNLLFAPPQGISLSDAAVKPMLAPRFLATYLSNIDTVFEVHNEHGFTRIREEWMRKARGLGEKITVRLPSEEIIGIFDGIDENGALLLGMGNGQQKMIHSGEVYFGPQI